MPGMRERNLAEIRRVNEIEEVITTDRIVARVDGDDRDAQPRHGCGRIDVSPRKTAKLIILLYELQMQVGRC
jgi:hypothetical protein